MGALKTEARTAFLLFALASGSAPRAGAEGNFIPLLGAGVPSNVVARTRLIRVAAAMATAFTIDVDRRQYLVTAKHVVAGIADGNDVTIDLKTRTTWTSAHVIVFKCKNPIDIAVLVPASQLTVNYELDPTHQGQIVGGDAFFVGFPFGLEHAIVYPDMSGVFGFIKRGTIAQLEWLPELQTQRIWLDGINNEGFSGSPVVVRDLRKPGYVFNVGAVISGFEWQLSPVYDKLEIKDQDITVADLAQGLIAREGEKVYRLRATGQVTRSNTGLVVAWDIESAVELIHRHPVGPLVSDNFAESP